MRVGSCHRGSDEAVSASDTAGTHATTHATTRHPRLGEAEAPWSARKSRSASSPTASASADAAADREVRSGASHREMTSSREQAAMGTSTAL